MQRFLKLSVIVINFNNPRFLKEKEKLNRQYKMIKSIYDYFLSKTY